MGQTLNGREYTAGVAIAVKKTYVAIRVPKLARTPQTDRSRTNY